MLHGSCAKNRRVLESHDPHWICHHVTTHPPRPVGPYGKKGLVRRVSELSPWDEPLSYNYVKDCAGVLGYCSVCLTDFETTVERPECRSDDPEMEMLNVTILSYHQLGPCRSPSDWKWQTFGAKQPSTPVTRKRYLDSFHEPAAVKRRWDADCGK